MDVMKLVEDILAHHGVKGQKWGVRRKRGAPSSDVQNHSTNKKKHVSELSDKELQTLVNRMNMQQQHSRLNPSKIEKGHKAVKTILAVGATANAVIAFSNTPAARTLSSSLAGKTRAFNPALEGLKKLG